VTVDIHSRKQVNFFNDTTINGPGADKYLMDILITGAEGFVGRNLTEMFVRDGDLPLHPTFQELDLTCSESVRKYLQENPVDVIVHSATTLRLGTDYPSDTCENNLRMFFNLLRYKSTSTKLINFGSGIEYSRKYWHEKMPETFFGKHIPDESHGLSKYLIAKYIEDSGNANLVTLRIFGIFGKYEDYRFKFISNAIAKNILGLPIIINQNVSYDYIYVDDFYRVVRHFAGNTAPDRSYNATPSQSIDLVTIANMINEVSDRQSDIQVLNEGLGTQYSGDNTRLSGVLGDIRISDYREAIADLYSYYRSNSSMLDMDALKEDDFLKYAKELHTNYHRKQ
jgi:UDP-glucose 4-epimerase